MQLAAKYSLQWRIWPMYVEPKVDGARCMIWIDPIKNTYRAWARSGSDWTKQCKVIAEEILACSKEQKPFILDGELWAGSWSETQSQIKNSLSSFNKLRFMIFDLLAEDVESRGDRSKFSERRARLEKLFYKNPKKSEVIESFLVKSAKEVHDLYLRFLREGFEGAMIKAPHMGYINTRTNSWMKYKPTKDVKATVLAIEAGDLDGRHAKRMGRIKIRVDKSDGGGVHHVGNGFTDEQREKIWKDRSILVGKRMEVAVQDGDILFRFPIFKRWIVAE